LRKTGKRDVNLAVFGHELVDDVGMMPVLILFNKSLDNRFPLASVYDRGLEQVTAPPILCDANMIFERCTLHV
jgi:hypothetical protein